MGSGKLCLADSGFCGDHDSADNDALPLYSRGDEKRRET